MSSSSTQRVLRDHRPARDRPNSRLTEGLSLPFWNTHCSDRGEDVVVGIRESGCVTGRSGDKEMPDPVQPSADKRRRGLPDSTGTGRSWRPFRQRFKRSYEDDFHTDLLDLRDNVKCHTMRLPLLTHPPQA